MKSSVVLLVTVAATSMLMGGCNLFTKYVYVEPPLVIIERPERPEVPVDPPEWTVREFILSKYATTLEAKVDSYNQYAAECNAANHYTDHPSSDGGPDYVDD